MGIDLRQVVAGILTVTMFVMLGRMIRRDYIDGLQEKFPGDPHDLDFDTSELTDQDRLVLAGGKGLWMEDGQLLDPCWTKSSFDQVGESKGFVTFSLANGPEYHVSQISDAVVVAKHLGATLVVPDIRGSKPGDERNFEDIYDVDNFMKSLDGVVTVVKDLPDEVSIRNLAVIKVPNRVTADYITENIEPVFKAKGNIRMTTFFPSVNLRMTTDKSNANSLACLAMFSALKLKTEVNAVVDSMVERLKLLSPKSEGRFIAVDLRVDALDRKNCHASSGTKTCYSAQEIALFLRKIGFGKDTTIYLTQSRWDSSLDILKDIFPKTYTKESIIPSDKKAKFLDLENSEIEKAIDFQLCSQSDVFVPAISGLFYANVVGKRIGLGKSQILVPSDIQGTYAPASDFISPYITKKNHLAYSCFC